MITEFSMRPKASNKRSIYLFIAFSIGAVAAALLYMFIPLFKGVVGIVAMIFIVGAVFIYTKYMAAEYIYDITVPDGTPLFVIRHRTGKRETTLCRIELSSIKSVERQTREQRREHKTPADRARYFYCPTFSPDETYLIISETRYEKSEISIEAGEEFASLLLAYAAEARSAIPEDDF